jgi:Helix-turn-helix of DDE superfamily endonuclease/DDE superfamily endonuclease
MITYTALKDRPREFLTATGLTHEEFLRLLPAFEAAYTACYPLDKTWHGKARQRKVGGGAKGLLAQMEDKVLFILLYQKTNPLQTMHGLHFGLSQPQTHYWIHRLLPVLRQALVMLGMAPERDASRVATHPLLLEGAPAGALDGTERRRQRPTDATKQRAHYSGKKKTHTDKNVLLINEYTSKVVYLSPTVTGQTHDKKAVDATGLVYPVNSTLDKDTGFQGYEPERVLTQQPKKTQRPGVERWRQVPQSSDRQCPYHRRTRDCWRETVPDRERCLSSDDRWAV